MFALDFLTLSVGKDLTLLHNYGLIKLVFVTKLDAASAAGTHLVNVAASLSQKLQSMCMSELGCRMHRNG